MAILYGAFTARVFSNWKTNYHVFRFETDTKTASVIYRDIKQPVINGDEYVLQGSWGQSERHGWQFYIRIMEPVERYTARHADNMEQLLLMVTT